MLFKVKLPLQRAIGILNHFEQPSVLLVDASLFWLFVVILARCGAFTLDWRCHTGVGVSDVSVRRNWCRPALVIRHVLGHFDLAGYAWMPFEVAHGSSAKLVLNMWMRLYVVLIFPWSDTEQAFKQIVILVFNFNLPQFFMLLEFSDIWMWLSALGMLTDLVGAERPLTLLLNSPHHDILVAILGLLENWLRTLKPLSFLLGTAVVRFY